MARKKAAKRSFIEMSKVLPAELLLRAAGAELEWTGVLEPDALGVTTDKVGGAAPIVIGIVRLVRDTWSVKVT